MLKICWWTNQFKKIMLAPIQTSASALGSMQTISSFKAKQKLFVDSQIVILFYFFTFSSSDMIELMFLAESQLSVKHAFMQIFLGSLHIYVTLVKTLTMNLNNVMLLYPRLTGKCGEEQHWTIQKLADQKGNRSLEVSVWTDNSAFLHRVFIKQTNFYVSQQINKCRPM